MTSRYPAAFDNFVNPSGVTDLDTSAFWTHGQQHSDLNDAVEAIEAQIGTTSAPVLARLPGVAGGQTLIGGIAASETLTLRSTSHATKGKVLLGTLSAYDEANDRLGIGTTSPSADLHALGTTEQLRLGYDAANYLSVIVNGAGEVEFEATGGTIAIQGTTDTDGPTLGSELLTTAGWTVPGGWTESPDDVFTHSNGGGTSALSHSASIANTTKYLVTWTISGRTTGSITVALGGQSSGSQTASSGFGPTTTSTAGLDITPTSDFDGVVSAVSLKSISGGAKPITVSKNSAGVAVYEHRANSGPTNLFAGRFSGQYCVGATGSNLTGFGYQALNSATTASAVTAFGYRSGYSTTVATNCSFFGSIAGNSVTSGTEHTLVGAGSGFKVVGSTGNTCVGYASGYNFTAGQNSCLGGYSGRYQSDGSSALAGAQLCCYIGYNAKGLNDSDWYSVVIGAQAVGLGAQTTVLGTINQTIAATIYGAGTFSLTNATTNAAVTVGTLTKNVTGAGVGAAGLGPRLTFAAESSTTADTTQADITATWTDSTHATRKSRLALSAYDTAAREGLRLEADGSVARLGFFGATAVVKPTALTTQLTTLTYTAPGTPDYVIADVTQTTPFGFTTADEGRTVLSVIKNLQDRVAQLESKLQGLGLLT